MVKEGNPEEIFDLYNAMIVDTDLSNTIVHQLESGQIQTTSGTGEAKVKDIVFIAKKGNPEKMFEVGEPVTLKVSVLINQDIPRLVLGFMIKDRLGQVIFGTNTFFTGQVLENLKQGSEYVFNIFFNMNLGPGDYSVATALVSSETHFENNYEWKDYAAMFKVVNVHNILFVGMNWLPVQFSIDAIPYGI